MTDKKYNADGTVYINNSGLEILLLEASGPYGTRDKGRHVFDHIKGAFGCYSMLTKILSTYRNAEASLMEDIRVIFIHTSAKGKSYFMSLPWKKKLTVIDDFIRAWIMRPVLQGEFISFERHSKVQINLDFDDTKAIRQVIEFFINLKVVND